MSLIRVLIVDDHPLMRDALRMTIEDMPDMKVVGEATSGLEAEQQADTLRPDVIVMDVLMPQVDGLTAIVRIKVRQPAARILALTSLADESKIVAVVQAGALGYVLKDAHREQLLEAIRQVAQGNSYFSPAATNALVAHLRQAIPSETTSDSLDSLTEREKEVLRLVGQGATTHDIAQALNLSDSTVRTHVHHILDKLGLPNRLQAVLYSQRHPEAG